LLIFAPFKSVVLVILFLLVVELLAVDRGFDGSFTYHSGGIAAARCTQAMALNLKSRLKTHLVRVPRARA
jgi:hypothetical protein